MQTTRKTHDHNGATAAAGELPMKQVMPRIAPKPFVHKFRTSRNTYALDVSTNQVLRLDPTTWALLDDFGDLTKEDMIRKHGRIYPAAEISAAYDCVIAAQERDGLLLPSRLVLAPPPTLQQAQGLIANKRRRLTLCVTENCNFRCRYCIYGGGYRVWRHHSLREMSWDVARLAIDDFVEHSYGCDKIQDKRRRFISFYGGEPLLNVALIERCVSYARKRLGDEATFVLTTNGSLLRGGVADFLAAENFMIVVSLDGPPRIHNYHRRLPDGSGTWNVVTQNIKDFLAQYPPHDVEGAPGPRLIIHATLSPFFNACDVEDFFCSPDSRDVLGDLRLTLGKMRVLDSHEIESLAPEDRRIPGLETLYRSFLAHVAGGFMNQDPLDRRRTVQRLLFARPFQQFLRRDIVTSRTMSLDGRSRLRNMCTPGSEKNCYVDVEGAYFPCERGPNYQGFKIGDVWSGVDVTKSWNLQRRFLELCDDACRQCWCVNICRVGCCAFVRDGGAISAEAKGRACDDYRKETHRMLTDLYEVLEANPQAFDFAKRTTGRMDTRQLSPIGSALGGSIST